MLAYKLDTLGYETCNAIADAYFRMKDMNNSITYYTKAINILNPVKVEIAQAYFRKGDALKGAGLYEDAISSYLSSCEVYEIPNMYMLIANIYDENLHDSGNAVKYYDKYYNLMIRDKNVMLEDYLEKIKMRADFLRKKPGKD